VSKAAKDLRQTDPKALRNEALRLANRVAKQNKPKYKEKIGPNRPQGPEAPKYSEKIGPTRPAPSKKIGPFRPILSKKIGPFRPISSSSSASTTASTGSKVLKYGTAGLTAGLMIGGGIGYLTSASGKKSPVSKTTGAGRPEFPSSNMGKKKIPMKPAPGSNYSGQSSTYSGYGNFNTSKIKTNATNTAATSTASASSGGGSQAATVANTGKAKAAKAKVGRQTRYQRNETAMEQRKSSSGKPKKSIFSLFRKG
jgi:hypothetical protein